MLGSFDFTKIIPPLLTWFENNRRILPWREEPTPYRVWISEIMLQQTRVQAVLPYFERFLKALPGVKELAECEEDRLLKLWEGLGYYNRAKNLKRAAEAVSEQYDGELPDDADALLRLPGIGPYTAGAILSIAYNNPYPAVDGNVMRILTRVSADPTDITKPAFRKEMEECLKPFYFQYPPSKLTQALMELGATVCAPNGAPHCLSCPWNWACLSHRNGEEEHYPVKAPKKARRVEMRTILLIRDGERFVLRKRPEKGLLAGLYELPGLSGHASKEEILSAVKQYGFSPLRLEELGQARHIFFHVEWDMTGYMIRIEETEKAPDGLFLVEIEESEKRFPVPSAFSYYMKSLQGENSGKR